jgi:signal transduction histidine kinase
MKDRLCLLFCDYFQEEVERLLATAQYKDIKLVFYSADCDKIQQSPTVLELINQQAKIDSVVVFAGSCLKARLKEFENINFQVEPLDVCFELLLPPAILEKALAEGAHLFTNGMLKQWQQINQRWGFEDKARKDFFTEGAHKLVLITHPQIAADETLMSEIASQLDLPWEKLEVSLDHLAARVFAVINGWHGKVIADKKRQLADYAMVNDLIAQISSLQTEQQVIEQVFELFHIFCGPARVCYLPVINDQPAGDLVVKTFVSDRVDDERLCCLLEAKKSYALDEQQASFQILVKHNEEKVGVLGVYGVAFPKYLNHYLNLARNIAPVIALAISNARTYQIQVSTQVHIRQLNSDLENQLDTVNALNHELESFTYTVSHDLREPLAIMEQFIQILRRDYSVKLDERGNNVLNRIVNNSKRMAELIDDLLRLSRLTRAELQPQTVSISQIAQELARDLQQTDSMRQAEFEIADDLTAQADPSLLRVVLENLLGNAWKYSRYQELTKIVIDQQREGNKVVFRIQDNGAGFDMAHAEFLFAPFRRLHTAEQFPGTGIGLATVQRIIQRHGGKIWATAAPNQGACFYFTLPPFV